MTLDELKARLREIAARGAVDPEVDHAEADLDLLKFIGDDDVSNLFAAIKKWYA